MFLCHGASGTPRVPATVIFVSSYNDVQLLSARAPAMTASLFRRHHGDARLRTLTWWSGTDAASGSLAGERGWRVLKQPLHRPITAVAWRCSISPAFDPAACRRSALPSVRTTRPAHRAVSTSPWSSRIAFVDGCPFRHAPSLARSAARWASRRLRQALPGTLAASGPTICSAVRSPFRAPRLS